ELSNPEDFEAGYGSWYATRGIWQIGEPASGPGSAHSGTMCAGTVLSGHYPSSASSFLVSAPVQLPPSGEGEDLMLCFWHWSAIEGHDAGSVWIHTRGTGWNQLSQDYSGSSGGWTRTCLDLEAYADSLVSLGFHFRSDGLYGNNHGWFIDDIEIHGMQQTFNVTWVFPPSGAAVPPDTLLAGRFSMPVDPASLSDESWQVSGSMSGEHSGNEFEFTNGDSLVACLHDPFIPGETVTCTLVGGEEGILSGGGETLTGDFVWQFHINTLPDTTGPCVERLSPPDDAENVPPNTNMTVSFSEPVDIESLEDGWLVEGSESGSHTAEAIEDLGDGGYRFDVSEPFAEGELVSVRLAETIMDAAGNGLNGLCPGDSTGAVEWSFTVQRVSVSVRMEVPLRRYALVSLPVDFPGPDVRLSQACRQLGQSGPSSWMGYCVDAGGLQSDPICRPGRGYWMVSLQAEHQLELEGPALASPTNIALEPGWSTIGVPSLDAAYDWSGARIVVGADTMWLSEPEASSALEPHFWWYVDETADLTNNGSYEANSWPDWSSLDNPLGGYFAYAREACTLIFPVDRKGVRGSAAGGTEGLPIEPDWEIDLTLGSGGASDRVTVGAWRGSSEDWDRLDLMKPPAFQDACRLVLIQEGRGWNEFMRIYDPPEAAEHAWELELNGNAGVASLSWRGVESVPPELNVYLVNPELGQAVDMRREGGTSLAVDGTGRRMQVLISEAHYQGDVLGPVTTGFTSVGPIPSKNGLGIRYELAAAGRVQIELYDVTGRRVEELHRGLEDRGRHSLDWRPGGMRIAGGVYFVRMQGPRGKVDTRRVVFLNQ
ncbi:MAG: hypothetical protein GF355_13010, partial [Candidatus Eisenbacteria bacterium]|nr:hypothetical protein [Candidatus Eisenbacteria bacterium]